MLKALLIAAQNSRVTSYPGKTPACLVEVLGAPVLSRIAEQLTTAGVNEIVVVTDIAEAQLRRVQGVKIVAAKTEEIWRVAERTFEEFEAIGVRGVIIADANQYFEIDWQAALAHHMHFRNRATRIWCDEDACDLYLVTPGRRNEAASLMRHRLKDARTPGVRYRISSNEYANPLRDCTELRKLSLDALYQMNRIQPRGDEIRPGVWVGKEARIEKGARVVGPAFIGEYARIHAGSVITRDSVIEHHTVVDCGSVVEDAWLQPFTAVGAGIDVTHAIVAGEKMFHLRRQVGFESGDPKLLRGLQESAAVRTMQAAAALLSFMPAMVSRSSRRKRVADCGTRNFEPNFEVVAGGKTQPGEPVAKLAPSLAVMRRYGNE